MSKLTTIDLKGRAYATVPTRIKEFREACPNGDIQTSYQMLEGGMCVFTAKILKDKSDSSSASATGNAMAILKGEKAFEKLETISIGRALAILGFMASGEVASSEEMEEFLAYQESKNLEAIESIKSAKTMDELKSIWKSLGNVSNPEVVKAKEEMKQKLS